MKVRNIVMPLALVVCLGLLSASLWVTAAASATTPRLANPPTGSFSSNGSVSWLAESRQPQRGDKAPGAVPGEWDSMRVNAPRVVITNSAYLMLYDGRTPDRFGEGLAASVDGIGWTKDAGNPVLQPGAQGEWDSLFRGQVSFLTEGDLFKIWYSGSEGGLWQTGYATSTNAIDWIIYPLNPVLPVGGAGDWDEQEANGPSVLLDGGVYKMWYHGCDPGYTACSIGYATSPDGVQWTKYPGNPVLTGTLGTWEDGFVMWPSVVKNGSTYLMWYSSFNYQIGLATSPDGIVWTKHPNNPVLADGWDGGGAVQANVLLDGGVYKAWFVSGSGPSRGIGYAESVDGIVWTMPYPNPMILPGSAGLMASVNYAHDWVVANSDPQVAVTITVADGNGVKANLYGTTDDSGEMRSWEWGWNPNQPDILAGDMVTVTAIGLETAVNPVGTIDGLVNVDTDMISGSVQAPWFSPITVTVRCEVWVENGPPPIEVSGVDPDGGTFACDFGSAGWDIQPGQDVAVIYTEPDGDQVINVIQAPWMRINYAHDWVGGNYPAGHTFDVEVWDGGGSSKGSAQVDSMAGRGWGGDGFETQPEDWNGPQPDIQPGDRITIQGDDGYTNTLYVGTILGDLDLDADLIAGSIQAAWLSPVTVTVRCDVWVQNGPPTIEVYGVDPDGGSYACDFSSVGWDLQPGQPVAVHYVEPDNDIVINVFEPPWMRVNYAQEWVGGNYPAGHTFWIEVRDGGGSLKGSMQIDSSVGGGWGSDGFQGEPDDWNDPSLDIQPGDWVNFQSDDGYTNTIHVGTVDGSVDVNADLVSGPVYAPWFSDTLEVECHPWGGPPGTPAKSSTAGPNGSPEYTCQWDPLTEWDVLAGEEIAAMYIEPDRDRVINVFHEPGPHLWIQAYGEGQPAAGGNLVLSVNYNNDGDAPADGLVITDELTSGMTYLGDTSGVNPTGSGAPGDPLVWQLGQLPPGNQQHQFQIFVQVDAPSGGLLENFAQIETSTTYGQGDPWSKESYWSATVADNNTDVAVYKNTWTWDPLPGGEYVYNLSVCNHGSTGSAQVFLTDTLPMSTTLVTWWGQNAGWSEEQSSDHLLVVSRPSVQDGWCGEVYLRVSLDANAWADMPISNTATIYTSNDVNLDNNQSTIWHQVGWPHDNLSINADWNYGTLVPGGELHYELGYQNNGNRPVPEVFITSTLPMSTSFSGAWYYDEYGAHPVTPSLVVPGEYVVWAMGALDNGYGGRMDIVLDVDPQAAVGTVLTHTVQINRLLVEDDFDDNQIAWVQTLNGPGPNLRLEKNAWWNWGGQLGYEIRIFNMGTQTLHNIWITDTYALSTTFNGEWWVNHGGWYTLTEDAANRQLIWWGEILRSGETASLGFNLDLDGGIIGQPGLSFTNLVEAPVAGDVYPADNQSSVTTYSGPDLFVEKSLSDGVMLPGELVTYTLAFGNGRDPGAGWWGMQGTAWLTDTLPEGLTFVASDLLYCGEELGCPFDPAVITGSQVIWQLWPLGSGLHNEIRLTLQVADTANGLDLFTNAAEIQSDQPQVDVELNTSNNFSSVSNQVNLPYFMVSKSYESSQVAGMPVTYTLQVDNLGFAAGSSVWLADWLPQFVTYIAGGSYANGQVSWTIPLLGAQTGQSSVWFSGQLGCSAGSVVNNWQYGEAGSDQGITSTYGAPAAFTILAPTIEVSAQASSLTALVGQTVDFSATGTTDGTPLAYEWRLDGAVIGQGMAISYAFGTPGSYTVTLIATDGCGFSSSEALTLTVSAAQSTILLPLIIH